MSTEHSTVPLEIRGHHLERFISLFRHLNNDCIPRKSLEEIMASGNLEEAIEITIDELVSSLKKKNHGTSTMTPEEYKEDVLGKTNEDETLYRNKLREIFHDFLTLPDNYPVKLVENTPDDICKATIVGHHCTITKDTDMLYDKNAIQGHLGLNTQPGDILPLKRLRWSLSIAALPSRNYSGNITFRA